MRASIPLVNDASFGRRSLDAPETEPKVGGLFQCLTLALSTETKAGRCRPVYYPAAPRKRRDGVEQGSQTTSKKRVVGALK